MPTRNNNDLDVAKDEAVRLLQAYAAAVTRVRELERGQPLARERVSSPQNATADIYTPATLADRWGCSERHVRNLISKGDLKSFNVGGRLRRIKAADVEAYEQPAERALLASSFRSGTSETSEGVDAIAAVRKAKREASLTAHYARMRTKTQGPSTPRKRK